MKVAKPNKAKRTVRNNLFDMMKTFTVSFDKGILILGSSLILLFLMSEGYGQKYSAKFLTQGLGNRLDMEEVMGKDFKSVEIQQFSIEEMIKKGEVKQSQMFDNITMRRPDEFDTYHQYLAFAKGRQGGSEKGLLTEAEYNKMMSESRGGSGKLK